MVQAEKTVFSKATSVQLLTALVLAVLMAATVTAPRRALADDSFSTDSVDLFKKHHNPPPWAPPDSQADQGKEGQYPEGQRELIAAQQAGQGLQYVEVKGVQVIQVLPDDTQGLRHQKWIVQLANGTQLLSVYNISICERVPVRVGDTVAMGGQYIWDKGGGLIHWIHEDPRHNRPDGYVEINGVRYGRVNKQNSKEH